MRTLLKVKLLLLNLSEKPEPTLYIRMDAAKLEIPHWSRNPRTWKWSATVAFP
nr:hypothetical protein Iba_chr15cCG0920 [Ipomoea batatas]